MLRYKTRPVKAGRADEANALAERLRTAGFVVDV